MMAGALVNFKSRSWNHSTRSAGTMVQRPTKEAVYAARSGLFGVSVYGVVLIVVHLVLTTWSAGWLYGSAMATDAYFFLAVFGVGFSMAVRSSSAPLPPGTAGAYAADKQFLPTDAIDGALIATFLAIFSSLVGVVFYILRVVWCDHDDPASRLGDCGVSGTLPPGAIQRSCTAWQVTCNDGTGYWLVVTGLVLSLLWFIYSLLATVALFKVRQYVVQWNQSVAGGGNPPRRKAQPAPDQKAALLHGSVRGGRSRGAFQ